MCKDFQSSQQNKMLALYILRFYGYVSCTRFKLSHQCFHRRYQSEFRLLWFRLLLHVYELICSSGGGEDDGGVAARWQTVFVMTKWWRLGWRSLLSPSSAPKQVSCVGHLNCDDQKALFSSHKRKPHSDWIIPAFCTVMHDLSALTG